MEMISKKDLLADSGISYGQLYRWKREGLIPEEWFIKQSSYTGQETFFPKAQIISRIESILEMKDKYTLEELARILAADSMDESYSAEELQTLDGAEKELAKILPALYGKEQFSLFEIAFVIAVAQASENIGLTAGQTADLIRKGAPAASSQTNTDAECIVFLMEESYHVLITPVNIEVQFDSDIEIADKQLISEIANKIRAKYKELKKAEAVKS